MTEESRIYFWRQIFVVSAVMLQSLTGGMFVSYPAVLNQSLLSPNSTDIRATPDQATWISSVIGISGAIGVLFLSPLMDVCGRKPVFIMINIIQMICWITICFANNVLILFISRTFQGLSFGAMYTNGIMISEYTSPVRRGYIISIKKMCMSIGILFCHSTAMFSLWRQTAAVGALVSFVSMIIALFWPESPSFYARKGMFEKCKKSFLWLQGKTTEKKRELVELILAQEERLKLRGTCKNTIVFPLKNLLKHDFQKPLLISVLLTICVEMSGRYYLFAHVVQIMNNLVGDKSVAVYYAIAGDCLTIISLFLSSFIIRYFRRRIVLLAFGFTSSLLMFAICLVIYLFSEYSITNLDWLSPCLILSQMVIVNMTLIPVSFTLTAEIFPLENRGIGLSATGLVFTLLYALTLKVTPLMTNHIGIEGTYAVYGFVLLLGLSILYFILPETKDKTLQNVENEIRNAKTTPLNMNIMLH